MSAKHTPGPWLAVENPIDEQSYNTLIILPGRASLGETWLAHVEHNWNDAGTEQRRISWAEAEANARLIAAAPDLLGAIEGLGAMPEGYCFCSEHRIGDDSKVHQPECRDLRAAIAKARGVA